MFDSNFDFKPNAETEHQCSDGVVFTGQPKSACYLNISITPAPPSLFSCLPQPWHLNSSPADTYFHPLILQRDPKVHLHPRARASQQQGSITQGVDASPQQTIST